MTKVVIDEANGKIEVVVPEEQLSLAIGRRGQNVRLASQLSGWALDILTEEQESERRQQEFKERSELFMAGLDVDEMVAQLLVSEGFETMEEVGYVALEDLTSIEGLMMKPRKSYKHGRVNICLLYTSPSPRDRG